MHPDAYRITQPIIVHSRADMASLLRAHRMSLGLTCEAANERAGFADRYINKLENDGPAGSGRKGFHFRPPLPGDPWDGGDVRVSFAGEIWPETLGLSFVLMPVELAKAVGAVPAPQRQAGA